MNAKKLIAALKALEGKDISARCQGKVHRMTCVEVLPLPPDQREPGQKGNVIIWNGERAANGNPVGIVLKAGEIEGVTITQNGATILDKAGNTHRIFLSTITLNLGGARLHGLATRRAARTKSG